MNNQSQTDSLMKIYTECIKVCSEALEKSDQINKRLVLANAITAIAFSICCTITAITVSHIYFTTDYGFGSQQIQSNTENSSQTITKGGKN